ncbi:MAG TPA: HEAT repeat domain-containing protein [Gemmatimonadaceae bacterium]|nr:HEAT repeat domain-containing protein [Gemmatimonadaceae bacterium]
MIKRALFGVALVVTAATASAQTPAPATAPTPPAPPAAFELLGGENFLQFNEAPDLEPLLPLEPMLLLERLEQLEPMLAPEPLIPFEPLMPLEPVMPLEPMIPFEQMSPVMALDLDLHPLLAELHDPLVTPDVAIAPITPTPVWHVPGQSRFEQQFGDVASEPPQAWAQADPADSLYRLARQTLNRGEYRRAAQLFGDITQRFPNSAYAADARYWKAFALYRIGGTSDLREALAALESDGRRYYQASLKADAATLASRIRGALAQRGDVRSMTEIERQAGQQGEPCDKEDAAVRVAALSSLGEMDQESTTPIFRRILAKRDQCSASLRRNALFLLAKRGDPEATALIITSARNDTDPRVRSEALRWLAKMPGDQALATLEEIARTPGNESLQRSAVAALARSESPRARQAIRNIIERNDVSESLRATALASVVGEHSSDGGAYLRSIYPRLASSRLKLGAIRALARIGGSENERWLLSLIRNQSEPLDVRSAALSYAGRATIPINDLVAVYDAAGERRLRTRLISLYGSRSEPEAADKLMAIAKTGTDPEMRRMAISALSRRKDPRTKKLLLEILDR